MIEIDQNKVNHLQLGSPKSSVRENERRIINDHQLIAEFDTNGEHTLITISARNQPQFVYERSVVNFKNIHHFIDTHDHFIDSGNAYIFPGIRLSLQIDFTHQIFLEVLVFDRSVAKQYVPTPGTFDSFSEAVIEQATVLELRPYESIGPLYFGAAKNEILAMFEIHGAGYRGVNDSEIYPLKHSILRFDHGQLTQLHLENIPPQKKILLDGTTMNLPANMGTFIQNNETLTNQNLVIFPEFGLTVNQGSLKGNVEMYFFDKSLLHLWKNTRRPITSW